MIWGYQKKTSNSWFNSLMSWYGSFMICIPLVNSLVTWGYLSASLYSRILTEVGLFPGIETRIGVETNGPCLEAWIMGWWIYFSTGHSGQGTNWLQDREANLAHRCEILGWCVVFYILNSMLFGEACTLQFTLAPPLGRLLSVQVTHLHDLSGYCKQLAFVTYHALDVDVLI